MICADCNGMNGHGEECPKFNPRQALANLRGEIESIQQLLDDDFEIKIWKCNGQYCLSAVHPDQIEEFQNDEVISLVGEVDDWVTHCNQGR